MSAEERYSLGLLYETAGRKSRALESYRKYFKGEGASAELGIKMVQFQISERKFAEAESLTVILRKAFPQNADVAALRGTIKYLARDTAAAVTRFHEALALDSLNEDALRTLAHISVVANRYEDAVSYYRRLTAQEAIGAPYRRGLAFLLFHIKEYEESERLLDTLIEERDGGDMPAGIMGFQELRLYRGMIYAKTDRKGKAAEEYAAAVAADPAFEDAWRELCFLHILAKDIDSALAVIDRYEAAFPKSANAWKFRGYAFNAGERREEAVSALRKAVALDSSDYFSWFELGSTLERLKRIDESADAFRAVLRVRPGDAPASNYLGYMWADADMMLDSAKLLIENALKKEPKNGAYLDSYAWVFYRLGDYEKAHQYMKEAMENHEEDDPVIYEHLGDILFKLNDYGPAAEAYKRSLDLKSEAADRIKERLAEIKKLIKGKGR
jgi:tetratricopeptide (TPR) repeat protein